jgi:hypothetical protein
LNLGRVPIGNTVITSFNSGSEPDVTLKNVNTGAVLDSKHIPFVDLIQDEILIKPEYAQGDSNYVPLSYTVDNGYGQIVFSIDAYDPNTVGVDDEITMPTEFKLEQNYPNPFNPSTRIDFQIDKSSQVKILIYNSNGELVETLIDRYLENGKYSTIFNATHYSSGTYFYTLQTPNYTETMKMILVK